MTIFFKKETNIPFEIKKEQNNNNNNNKQIFSYIHILNWEFIDLPNYNQSERIRGRYFFCKKYYHRDCTLQILILIKYFISYHFSYCFDYIVGSLVKFMDTKI